MWKPNQVPSIFSPFQLTNFWEESHPQHKDHFIDIRVLLETIEAMIKSSSSLGVIKIQEIDRFAVSDRIIAFKNCEDNGYINSCSKSKKLRYNVYGRSCKLVVLQLFHSGFDELGMALECFSLLGFHFVNNPSSLVCVRLFMWLFDLLIYLNSTIIRLVNYLDC